MILCNIGTYGHDSSREFVTKKGGIDLALTIQPKIAPANAAGPHFNEHLVGLRFRNSEMNVFHALGTADRQRLKGSRLVLHIHTTCLSL
jgi:hypothetical protein